MFSVILLPLGSELLLGSTISPPPLSLSALVLCFFDWAWKSNLSGLQNYGTHLFGYQAKATCSTKLLSLKKRNTLPPFATFLSFYFSTFPRILVGGRGTIYWACSHFIKGLHLPNTVLMSAVTWVMSSTFHSLCYLALGTSPPHTLNLHFVSVELDMEGKIPYLDL